MSKFLLKDVKFWYIPWQRGIAFTAFGFKNYRGHECIEGEDYIFRIDMEMDSFLLPNGELLPIYCATLCDAEGRDIPFDTFTRTSSGMIQTNKLSDHGGYSCRMVNLDELYIQGDSYNPLDE